MSARKAKKRAHVSDSDHDSAEDEHPEVASITCPQFSGEFSSWDAFHEELTRYQEETHQLYKTRSTNSVADRNKHRTAVATRRGTTAVLFDESLGFDTKTLIYTHGWTFKPRGKGSRTNHYSRSIDCPAQLSTVLVQSGDGSYKVRVSKHIATHNHDVGRDVYYSYAEARKITSPGTRGVVKTLVQGGSKKKKILRYLKKISRKPVLPKDVKNLVAKMRKETYTSEDDNEPVAQVLRDFSEGPRNASAEDRYTTKVKRVGFRHNRNYDNEMAMLAKLATHHACNLVEEQYRASGQETYDISSDENTPSFFTLSSAKSVLLPCRHILYLRRQRLDLRSIIPCESIPERRLLADEDDEEDAGDPDTTQKFYVEDIEAPPSRVLGHNEKYRSGFAVCQKIAEMVADKGSRRFRAWLDFLTQLEGVARHNDMPPSYRDLSTGVEVTNSGSVGERVTNSDGVGEQITNVGEPIPSSSFVEQDANLDRADAGEDVTNSDDAGDNGTNSDDAGKDDTNSGSVLTPDSSPEIKIEKGARVELTSTPASARRKLDLDSVGSASSDEEIVNIVLNTASRPARRPREKKAVKKAKRRKEFDDTKTLVQQIYTHGDITLSDLREYVEQKKLSLEKVEPVLNTIRPRHDDAIFKRPKGHVLTPGTAKTVEANIRFVLPRASRPKSSISGAECYRTRAVQLQTNAAA
ncbi:hypothetical protein PI124_g20487 [Phytophthora idaei]|nr:hypothetical protein PI124_g20487 [Phytophthora idaei]